MKTFQYSRVAVSILVALFAISLSSCHVQRGTTTVHRTTVKSKPLPPGHAKKVHGSKSAKQYAPGHNK